MTAAPPLSSHLLNFGRDAFEVVAVLARGHRRGQSFKLRQRKETAPQCRGADIR